MADCWEGVEVHCRSGPLSLLMIRQKAVLLGSKLTAGASTTKFTNRNWRLIQTKQKQSRERDSKAGIKSTEN